MSRTILRLKQVLIRVGCGKTKWDEDYRYHSDDDPDVPGAPGVKRVKPIPLGERNIGYLENEVDKLIDGLAALRNTGAGTRTRVFLTDARPPKLDQKRHALLERRALRARLEEIEQLLRELK